MNVTLSQLRAFERIVRLGSFRAAAQELRLTQPSVSQRIRELEAVLKTPLFVRRGPRVSLTAEGHALIEYADRLLGAAGEMVERFQTRDPLEGDAAPGPERELRADLPAGAAAAPRAALSRHQDLGVRRRHGRRQPHARRSRNSTSRSCPSPRSARTCARSRSAGTSWAGLRARISSSPATCCRRSDLCQFHLIVSPPTARLHTTVTKWFAEAAALPQRVSTCNSLSVTMLTILHGTAIGLVPVRVMQDELERRPREADSGIARSSRRTACRSATRSANSGPVSRCSST